MEEVLRVKSPSSIGARRPTRRAQHVADFCRAGANFGINREENITSVAMGPDELYKTMALIRGLRYFSLLTLIFILLITSQLKTLEGSEKARNKEMLEIKDDPD